MLERLDSEIREYGRGSASARDVCRVMMEEGTEHTEIFAKSYTEHGETALAVLDRDGMQLPQLSSRRELAEESLRGAAAGYGIVTLDLDMVMHAIIQGNFPDGVILNPGREGVIVTIEDIFTVLQEPEGDPVDNSSDSEKNVENDPSEIAFVKLSHVEEVLDRRGAEKESITALAFALLQEAEEGRSIICAGSDEGEELAFYPEFRGDKCYYQFYTDMDHAPKDMDLMALPMEEFFDLVEEAEAGFLFNSGEAKEFAVEPEMILFLKNVLKLSK